jgi:hypothetical protein
VFKHFLLLILSLLPVLPLLAQDAAPSIEVVLSTSQAQRGDTVYADVNIRNGQSVAGADVGISTDECLRVAERQPGNYLPATGENGGFSVFEELNEHDTRLAASVTDRTRVANGDGTFYRVAMEVICDEATPQVTISFAQLAALANPDSGNNDLLGFSVEQGNLPVVNTSLLVQPGAIAATVAPISAYQPPSAANIQPIVYAAVGLMFVSGAGLVLLFAYYRRGQRQRS